MSDGFDSLRTSQKGGPRTCRRCGETASEANVQIRLGEGTKGPLVTSKSRALCEPCAVRVYRAIDARFEEMLDGGFES